MENWRNNLAKLKNFKKIFGHADVPLNWKADEELSEWTETLRTRKRLQPELKKELEKIGFKFTFSELDNWDEMYGRLKAYYDHNGYSEIPTGDYDYELLRRWSDRQRRLKEHLTISQVSKLDQIDFIWDTHDAGYMRLWLRGFARLKAYYEQHGTTDIKWSDTSSTELFNWNINQIQRLKRNEQTRDKIRLLDSLGFNWNAGREQHHNNKWMESYEELKRFKHEHGHCLVPFAVKKYKALHAWVNTNRLNEDLSAERKRLLEEIDFVWSPLKDQWNEMYAKLKAFYKKHGHIKVTETLDPKLRRWLVAQEEKSSISRERKKKLEALGIVWKKERFKQREVRWSSMFLKLKKFYKEHGHHVVPLKNRSLYNFVKNTREWNKELTEDQRRKLKSIDFNFNWQRSDMVRLHWEKRYQELKEFHNKFGHSTISAKDKDYASLGLWIAAQRKQKKKLTAEQIKKLDALGFDWNSYALFNQLWEARLEELKEFKKRFGHLHIKSTSVEFKALYSWIYQQRKNRKKLSGEQVEKLSAVGFEW